MGEMSASKGCEAGVLPEPVSANRREIPRLEVSLPVRICPFDADHRNLEEVQRTLNFNHRGIYFSTRLQHYCPGMRVLLALPYSTAAPTRREYLGKVVRLQPLQDGFLGVAVQIFP